MGIISKFLAAAAYFVGNGGYYEKANGTAKYLTRDVSNFAANKGSANWTYFGKMCGLNPAYWCAFFVSVCLLEAFGGSVAAAKAAMWGIWPYAACNQLFDAALAHGKAFYSYYQRNSKGRSGAAHTPQPGEVIVFSDNGSSRDHTGIVYACDGTYVYTYEGNSGNMARKRSYALTSNYIYGYVQLNVDDASGGGGTTGTGPVAQFQSWLGTDPDGIYGPATKKAAIQRHQHYLNTLGANIEEDGVWGPATFYATEKVQQNDDNDDVEVWQGLLYCNGQDPKGLDGTFGTNTVAATEAFQTAAGLNATGVADRYTWAKMMGYSRPTHTMLRRGCTGPEVKYLQQLLSRSGVEGTVTATDSAFGKDTEAAVKAFQAAKELEVDGVCGPLTWAALE